jgi:hypothetical protein
MTSVVRGRDKVRRQGVNLDETQHFGMSVVPPKSFAGGIFIIVYQ